MKRPLACLCVVTLALCLAACGESHESLMSENLSTMEEMISVLEGVKDEASAERAKPKLKKLAERLNDLQARQSKLETPTDAEIKAMDNKYSTRMEELEKNLMAQMMRIGFDPKINAVLNDIDLN